MEEGDAYGVRVNPKRCVASRVFNCALLCFATFFVFRISVQPQSVS